MKKLIGYVRVTSIISKNKGNKDIIIDTLAKLPLIELNKDKNNPYYVNLAIKRKEELDREKNLVDPRIIQKELRNITKENNFAYKRKKNFNIKNNLDSFEQNNYERNIKKNFASSIREKLITKILNTNDI